MTDKLITVTKSVPKEYFFEVDTTDKVFNYPDPMQQQIKTPSNDYYTLLSTCPVQQIINQTQRNIADRESDMTNKIITTFDTNITWFDPCDKLPENTYEVLIRTKHHCIFHCIYLSATKEFLNEQTADWFSMNDVEYWAYCPEFE